VDQNKGQGELSMITTTKRYECDMPGCHNYVVMETDFEEPHGWGMIKTDDNQGDYSPGQLIVCPVCISVLTEAANARIR